MWLSTGGCSGPHLIPVAFVLDGEGAPGVEAEQLLGRGDLVGPEGGTVGRPGVTGLRGRPGDDGAQQHQGRPVGARLGRLEGGEELVDVLVDGALG